MKLLKNLSIFGLSMFLLVALISCQQLDVVNQNEPEEERSLATPANIEALIGGSFVSWWQAIHVLAPSQALITTADALSASWGNWGMQDLSSEPRIAIRNSTFYTYREVYETPWYGLYGAIASVNDGLKSIAGGIQIGTNGANNPRAQAFAKFVQGLAHGYVALLFDKGYILDETIDVTATIPQLKPYNEVMAAAISQLEAAIALCQANTFTLPSTWINGLALKNTELAQVANSFIARYRAQVARTAAERGQVDWAKVIAHGDQGITKDFAPQGDGYNQWYHGVQRYGAQGHTSWHRADYKLIGPSDKSTGYQNWLSKPPAERTEFEINTDDKRIWNGTRASNGRQNPGKYFKYEATGSPFPPDRGLYHFSRYGWDRYDSYFLSGGIGPMPIFLPTELDLLKAEGLLWTNGDLNIAATLINKTRVTNGELSAASATDGAGSVTDLRHGLMTGGTLWAKLKYERGLECLGTGAGLEFFDRRGWNELVTGSPLHFPVPAKELQVTGQGVYTFGGGGPGSAP